MAKTLAAEMVPLPVTALPPLPKVPLPPMAMSLPGPVIEPPFRMTALPPAAVGRQNRAFGQGQGAVYCEKQNNAASSKKSSARGRTRAEKLEHKIKTKLRHHRDLCSSVKYESDNEKLARKLKDLFNEKDEARKAQYVEWLNSCFAYIMPKDADYKGLYDFLMK